MKETQNFTEGPILSKLIGFALPVLMAIFLQTMYGAVDMLIVGQFSAAAEVSAVSTGSWIMQTVTATITGMAMGTTILLGRKIGEGKGAEGGSVIGASLYFFGIVGAILTVLLFVLAPQVAGVMQAPVEALASTVSYIRICAVGTVFIVGYNLLGSIFRGIGNAKMPLISVTIACVLNIIGDLVLVGSLGMGAAGAAVATVVAQGLSVLISALIIRKQSFPFLFSVRDVKWHKGIVGRVVQLGGPIALQELLVCISFLAITAIVNGLGVVASAGVGVAQKICGFVLLVPSAYMQAMSAFVAQNMGAAKPDRAKKALFYAIGTSLLIGVFLAYFSFFHGDLIAGLFAKEEMIILAAADYLKAYAVDCLLVSFLFCFIGYFNGCGVTKFVLVQGIVGAFMVRIPVSYLMSKVEPISLFRVGLATPASTVVQVTMCIIALIWIEKSSRKKVKNKNS